MHSYILSASLDIIYFNIPVKKSEVNYTYTLNLFTNEIRKIKILDMQLKIYQKLMY